jgi:hypothetical protein
MLPCNLDVHILPDNKDYYYVLTHHTPGDTTFRLDCYYY